MEQRILQYRKSIDEWLEKTEQSAQVSQEILRDKMEEHLNHLISRKMDEGTKLKKEEKNKGKIWGQ